MFGHFRPSRSRRETRGVGVPAAVESEAGVSTRLEYQRGWSINDVLNTPTIIGSTEPHFVLSAKLGSCGALDHGLLHGFRLVAHWRRIVHR